MENVQFQVSGIGNPGYIEQTRVRIPMGGEDAASCRAAQHRCENRKSFVYEHSRQFLDFSHRGIVGVCTRWEFYRHIG
jgi:hypothetical protein